MNARIRNQHHRLQLLSGLLLLPTLLAWGQQLPGVDMDALRAEDNQLQALIDEVGFAKVCNEYHLWFWCKDPATGEKQQRAVKARYDMNDKLIGIVMTPDSFRENPAVRMLKDKGRLDFCSHPEWFPTK
jgi:hypothetical protein